MSLLLISPLLILLMSTLPIALPLLYSDAFLDVLPMVKVAIFAMFMRSLELPVSYIALSRGDSKAFFLTRSNHYLLFYHHVLVGAIKMLISFGIGLGLVVNRTAFLTSFSMLLPIKSIAFASQNECFYTLQYSYLWQVWYTLLAPTPTHCYLGAYKLRQ